MAKAKNLPKIPRGRPQNEIDWKTVESMLEAGCSGCEVAAFIGVHHDTLYHRVEEKFGMIFSQYSAQFHQKGEANLRAIQYLKATGQSDKGDNTMLIFLGKTRLKQKENHETATTPNDEKINTLLSDVKSMKDRIVNDQIRNIYPDDRRGIDNVGGSVSMAGDPESSTQRTESGRGAVPELGF